MPRITQILGAITDDVGQGTPVHDCGEAFGGILGIVMGATTPEKLDSPSLFSAPMTILKAAKEAFACGHASWQEAQRIMGSQGQSERLVANF
jgi:hypothetical protein